MFVAANPGPLTCFIALTTSCTAQASTLDLANNGGHFRVFKSTGAKYVRFGSYEKACYAFTTYNRSGGQVLKGLKLRREYGDTKRIGELELCLEGLK